MEQASGLSKMPRTPRPKARRWLHLSLATLILGPLLLLALPGQISVRMARWILARLSPIPEERVHPGERNDAIERAHLARYNFAKPYCAGKRVADIASGTGYGIRSWPPSPGR